MKSRAVMLSVLDDGRKLTPFVILKRKCFLKLKKLVELYLNRLSNYTGRNGLSVKGS
jgi:hypothetical protein